jgi:sterol desaturase/sphingolipid hydroxylase (fatty acid hydroxylase superfamily)
MIDFIFHIVCYDLWFYATHLVLHHPLVYHIHRIHHAKPYNQLHYLDTNEGHWVEHVVQPLGIFIPCFFSGFEMQQLVTAYVIVAARALMRHDDRCSFLIGNHHILHHKHRRCNYGEYWIDCVFGTVYPDPERNEYVYGLIYT